MNIAPPAPEPSLTSPMQYRARPSCPNLIEPRIDIIYANIHHCCQFLHIGGMVIADI